MPEKYRGEFGYGDVWLWTAICADCKLIPFVVLGHAGCGRGHDLHARSVEQAGESDPANDRWPSRLHDRRGSRVRLGLPREQHRLRDAGQAVRQGPGWPRDALQSSVCLGTKRNIIHGDPDPAHISTSYVERSNLTIRMGNRRYTRLTNAFSKRSRTTFTRSRSTSCTTISFGFTRRFRCTPAMEAGVTDRLWSLEDMVGIVDEWEANRKAESH